MPWYRQFWPWFLIVPPATAVVAGIATVIIAAHDPDSLVVDDYYRQGLAINRDLARIRNAEQLGMSGTLTINIDSRMVTLQLDNIKPDTEELTLRFIHPLRAHKDQQTLLHYDKDKSGQLIGIVNLKPEDSGVWRVILEPADLSWRLGGQLTFPQQTDLILKPS